MPPEPIATASLFAPAAPRAQPPTAPQAHCTPSARAPVAVRKRRLWGVWRGATMLLMLLDEARRRRLSWHPVTHPCDGRAARRAAARHAALLRVVDPGGEGRALPWVDEEDEAWLSAAFARSDADGSGTLDLQAWRTLVVMLDQCRGTAGRSAADVARMFAYADAEASGTVQFAELLAVLRRAELNYTPAMSREKAVALHTLYAVSGPMNISL
jgi:hypothetical protein